MHIKIYIYIYIDIYMYIEAYPQEAGDICLPTGVNLWCWGGTGRTACSKHVLQTETDNTSRVTLKNDGRMLTLRKRL